MQAHKAKKGQRFIYSSGNLSHYGMVRAWTADNLSTASFARRHGFSKVYACKRVMVAQRWRLRADQIRKDGRS